MSPGMRQRRLAFLELCFFNLHLACRVDEHRFMRRLRERHMLLQQYWEYHLDHNASQQQLHGFRQHGRIPMQRHNRLYR